MASLADLIVAKLEWSVLGDSGLQRTDVQRLLEAGWDELDRSLVERAVAELGLEAEWARQLAEIEPDDPRQG